MREFISIELEYDTTFKYYISSNFHDEVKKNLCNLEERKDQLLKVDEEEWRSVELSGLRKEMKRPKFSINLQILGDLGNLCEI